jgi:DNA-binding response OmpR family regulator
MKIILVDDDAFLRDMYATKFRELGYEIDVAETAEFALSKLRAGEYQVALMDMVMPGMSGVDLIKQIKTEKLGGNPICVMLSNQSEEADKKAALDAGAVGYIVKAELIPSEVVSEVQKLVGKSK